MDTVSALLHGDLDKVSAAKATLLKEKAVVDSQLRAGVQAQISATTQGIQSLSHAQMSVYTMTDGMAQVERIKEDAACAIPDLAEINRLAKMLERFELVDRFVDNFKNMTHDLDTIAGLMDQDLDGQYELAPELLVTQHMPNLLQVHYSLSLLRCVRDDAYHYAELSTDDTRRTTTKHFEKLDAVCSRLDTVIFTVAGNLVGAIEADNGSLIVRVAKIVDAEERRDSDAAIVAQERSKGDSVNLSLAKVVGADSTASLSSGSGTSSSALVSSHRRQHHYLDRFFEAVEKSFGRELHEYMSDDPDTVYELRKLLESPDWILQRLAVFKYQVTACLPPSWKAFDRFLKLYHQGIYNLLEYTLSSDYDMEMLLQILDFVKNYYRGLIIELEVDKAREKLSPRLLNGRDKELYDQYLNQAAAMLAQWKESVAVAELALFRTRDKELPVNDQGIIYLPDDHTMLKIVDQQIHTATGTNQARLVAGSVAECARVLKDRQEKWEAVMRAEVEKQTSDDESTEVVPALFEYTIALTNGQIRAADFIEDKLEQLKAKMTPKYAGQIKSDLESVAEGFLDLMGSCFSGLVKIIFHDLEPALSDLFKTTAWAQGITIGQVVVTLKDYIVDAQRLLNPAALETFLSSLVEECIVQYLAHLTKAPGSIDESRGSPRIDHDRVALLELFLDFLPPDAAEPPFMVFDHLLAVIQTPTQQLDGNFLALRNDFWDAPLELFETMIRCRKDLDSRSVKKIMERLRSQFHQHVLQQQHPQEQGGPADQATFLSRFTDKVSKLSRG